MLGPLAYFGAFGQTGSDYFRECWAMSVAVEAQKRRDPVAATAGQAVAWASCDDATREAIFTRGFVFAGAWLKPEDRAVYEACPTPLSFPADAAYARTIQLVIDSGGPQLLDRFLPADHMIGRVWIDRWPRCSIEREKRGIPKICRTAQGFFSRCT